LLSYLKDLIWTLVVAPRFARGGHFVLTSNNLLGFAALVFRRIGLVDRVTYLIVDYSPRRFGLAPAEWLYRFLDRWVAVHADSVWTMSHAMIQGRVQAGRFREDEVTVRLAPMGNYAHETFRDGVGPAFDMRRLVYVGNPNARNVRADLLIEVVRILRHEFTLCFVGPGETSHLRRRTEEINAVGSVEFWGSIADPIELERRLATCGVGLAPYDPTLKDNFSQYADPAKIKTYLGSSLPVLSTRVPTIVSELEARGAGEGCDFSAEAFADSIERLWNDPARYGRMRARALEFGREFSWPRIFSALLDQEGF
jgi:glycosyltransferase involved in cell wall biosynthesis